MAAASNFVMQGVQYDDVIIFASRSNQNIVFGTSNNSNMLLKISSNGNVGVGLSNPGFRMDVAGDLNFSGVLRQGGVPYVGSQWSNSGANVFLLGSNVGIGVSNPGAALHVACNVRVDGALQLGSYASFGGLDLMYGSAFSNSGGVILTTSNIQGYSNLVHGASGSNGTQFSIMSNTATDAFRWVSGAASNELMRLTGNGLLGVGASAPASILHLASNGAANVYVTLCNAATGGRPASIGLSNSGDLLFALASNNNMLFLTSNAERMRVANNGCVGIGTSNPAADLHIAPAGAPLSNNIVIDCGGGDNSIPGYSYIGFNGYYAGTEQRINASKIRYRIYSDQRAASDVWGIDTWDGTTGATKFSICNANYVNIGNSPTDPSTFLTINTADGDKVYLTPYPTGSKIAHSNGWTINICAGQSNFASGNITFNTGNTVASGYSERMRISSSGVGIGTNAPAYGLDVLGTARFYSSGAGSVLLGNTTSNVDTDAVVQIAGVASTRAVIATYQGALGGQGHVVFCNPSGRVGSISTSNNALIVSGGSVSIQLGSNVSVSNMQVTSYLSMPMYYGASNIFNTGWSASNASWDIYLAGFINGVVQRNSGYFSFGSVGGPTTWTVPYNGLYEIKATFYEGTQFSCGSSDANNQFKLKLLKNGGMVTYYGWNLVTSGTSVTINAPGAATAVMQMTTTDTISLDFEAWGYYFFARWNKGLNAWPDTPKWPTLSVRLLNQT